MYVELMGLLAGRANAVCFIIVGVVPWELNAFFLFEPECRLLTVGKVVSNLNDCVNIFAIFLANLGPQLVSLSILGNAGTCRSMD